MSGSGISWSICKSATRSRQITTPAPHRSVFLQSGCPSCHPTNGIKALKAIVIYDSVSKNGTDVADYNFNAYQSMSVKFLA